MSTTKGNLALQLLDAARCDGDWDIIPERCLKVVKHAPGRRCTIAKNPGWKDRTANTHEFLGLVLTAQTEARLQQLLPPPPPDSSPSTIVSYIVSLDALQDPLEAELEGGPQELPRLPSPATGGWSPVVTREDLIQARVVIASICVLKGEWNEALRIIPHEREVEEWDGGGGGSKGDYFNIVRIKSLVLKGIALSHTNQRDLSLPLLLYRTATRLAPTLSVSRRDSPSLLLWTERALAHYAFAAYRCWLDNNAPDVPTPPVTTVPVTPRHAGSHPGTARNTLIFSATPGIEEEEEEDENQVGVAIGKSLVDEGTVATAFRDFHTFVSRFGQVSKPRPSTAKSTATRPSTGRPGTSKTNFATAQLGVEPKGRERQEVYRHYYRFLSLLLLPPHHPQRPIPRSLPSGSSRDEKGSSVAVNGSGYSSSGFGETAGAGPQLQEEFKLIELAYEGYLLRNLEFPEAVEYHEAIGEWVDLVTENWHTAGGSGDDAVFVVEILYRASEKTFLSPRILRHLFTTLSAVGNLLEAEMALNTYLDLIQKGKERLAKGSMEVDFDTDKQILETAAEGIRFLCKHMRDWKKGMDLAGKCEEWMDEWHVNDAGVLSDIYKAIGIANASWAFQSIGGGDREATLRAAEKAFKRGLRYSNKDADAWYGLALAQVELRDIVPALESINKGLQALSHELVEDEYRRRAVPMLHLLALLMSANEEYESARGACTRALDILEDHTNHLGISEKESALQIQMTQLSLVEATEGLDVAVGMTEKLLNLYSRVFDGIPRRKLGLGDPYFESLAVNGRTSTGQSSRPSTAQRISRLFLRNKREHSPLSPNRLPPLIEPPSPSHNVLRKASLRRHSTKRRPRSETQSPNMLFDTPPKIQVTDTNGGTSPADMPPEKRKTLRRNSVSGGTIRRMRSLGSRGSSLSPTRTGSKKNNVASLPPQPVPMSSAGASRIPTGVNIETNHNGGSGEPNQPQLFHILKSKLHYSQPGEDSPLELPSDSSAKSNGTSEKTHIHTEGTGARASEIPNNLPRSRLPHPISALGSTIADGSPRSISRRMKAPEPKLIAADEKLKAMGILRSVWLFVAALYRRGGFFEDATMAIDEATALVEDSGEGGQDVLAERGFLALAQGKKSEAADLFESALFIDVDYPPAIVGLSQILLDIPHPIPATQPPSQEPFQSHLIGRNRVLALLQSLTSSPRGWNMPEAWFELSRAFEMEKDVKNAKSALWKVIELEDVRGVRSYGCVCPRII